MVARTQKQAGKPARKIRRQHRVNDGFEGIEPLKFHVMPLKAFIMSVHPMWYSDGKIYKLIDRTVMEGQVKWFRIPDHLDTIYMSMENQHEGWELRGDYVGTKEAIAWLRAMQEHYWHTEKGVSQAKEVRGRVFSLMEKQMCLDQYAVISGTE